MIDIVQLYLISFLLDGIVFSAALFCSIFSAHSFSSPDGKSM